MRAIIRAGLVCCGALALPADAAEGPPPSPMAVWLGFMEQWANALGDSRDQESRARMFAELRRALPCGGAVRQEGGSEDAEYCPLDPQTGDKAR